MSTLDSGLTLIKNASQRVSKANGWMGNAFKSWMPTGLYARALLIMIVPMVILQTVVAFVFMERHWNTVTRRLSAAVVSDIAALIDVYKNYPQDKDRAQLRHIAQKLQLVVDFLPAGDMPPPGPKPFFSLLDQTLSVQLGRQISRPFWIDTVGKSNLVEIRVQLDDSVMRIFAQRSAAYASNSEIFIFWMLGTSTILLIVAVLFLRNQIKPILRLADAAESFGKGREAPNFRPRDLVEPKFDKGGAAVGGGVGTLPMMQTSATHMAASGAPDTFDNDRGKSGFQTRPAGNAVNLEEQMLKVSANQMDFAAATSLYSKSLHLLKTAIGKG